MLVVGSGILSPLYSQSDSTKIATIDLDSLYSKAVRGLAAIQDNKDKNKAIKFCDSAKAIQAAKIAELQEMKVSFEETIKGLKDDKKDLLMAVKMANHQIKIENKIGRKKWWKGLTWGAVGVLALELASFFIFK